MNLVEDPRQARLEARGVRCPARSRTLLTAVSSSFLIRLCKQTESVGAQNLASLFI